MTCWCTAGITRTQAEDPDVSLLKSQLKSQQELIYYRYISQHATCLGIWSFSGLQLSSFGARCSSQDWNPIWSSSIITVNSFLLTTVIKSSDFSYCSLPNTSNESEILLWSLSSTRHLWPQIWNVFVFFAPYCVNPTKIMHAKISTVSERLQPARPLHAWCWALRYCYMIVRLFLLKWSMSGNVPQKRMRE